MKVALIGFGHMAKVYIRYVIEQGHEVVAVIGKYNVDEDAGVVAGLDAPINVKITHPDNAKAVIAATKPTVGLVATRSLLADVYDSLLMLAEARVNCVTISEETFYSWNTNYEATAELDQAFRRNGVSLTATGAQYLWGFLPSLMLGCAHKVDAINGLVQYNVDDYGKALCILAGAGLTVDKFNEIFKKDEQAIPSYVWNSNEWLCGKMKWKIISTKQTYEPIIAEVDTPSASFGEVIKAGNVLGSNAIVVTTAETATGKQIVITTSQIGKVYGQNDEDQTNFACLGEPNLEICVKRPDTVGITCASMVNRINSVVNARAGYVPSYELDLPSQKY